MTDKQHMEKTVPEKKATLLRIVIFLMISFGLPYAMIFTYIANCGWNMEGSFYGAICSVSMLCPALANILTRLLTREGAEELALSLDLRGRKKYYCIALFLPLLFPVIIVICVTLFLLPGGSLSELLHGINYGESGASALYLLSMSLSALMFGFGEEFGWRGYLTPKLEKLLPSSAAIAVSGVIWGLWHAPLIACGHNFGKGYPGDPWLGIALMCISCVGLSYYLTALTKATGSSLTAGIAHMSINNTVSGLSGVLLTGLAQEKAARLAGELSFGYGVISMGVMTVIAAAVGVIILVRLRNGQE